MRVPAVRGVDPWRLTMVAKTNSCWLSRTIGCLGNGFHELLASCLRLMRVRFVAPVVKQFSGLNRMGSMSNEAVGSADHSLVT